MPTLNIYFQDKGGAERLQHHTSDLRAFIAKELTCGDITLSADEVSVRFIESLGGNMIAPIEVEITAHIFPERVERQDKICLAIRDFLKEKIKDEEDIRVWLKLTELGHSWES